jgi:hypothetical protein
MSILFDIPYIIIHNVGSINKIYEEYKSTEDKNSEII